MAATWSARSTTPNSLLDGTATRLLLGCIHVRWGGRRYELCSAYGLYVVEEANLESHGFDPTFVENAMNPACKCVAPRLFPSPRFPHTTETRRHCAWSWSSALPPVPLTTPGTMFARPRRARSTAWAPAIMDRISRMYERSKNLPCVALWSLGNEAGHGPVHDAMAAWLRARDATRPVHYEVRPARLPLPPLLPPQKSSPSNIWQSSGPRVRTTCVSRAPLLTSGPGTTSGASLVFTGMWGCATRLARLLKTSLARCCVGVQGGGSRTPATDVVCPMYPRLPQLQALLRLMESGAERRPLLLCEYSHSMNNSTGERRQRRR